MYSDFQHGVWELLSKVGNGNIPDIATYRQIRFMSVVGPAALPAEELDRVSEFLNKSLCSLQDNLCVLHETYKRMFMKISIKFCKTLRLLFNLFYYENEKTKLCKLLC